MTKHNRYPRKDTDSLAGNGATMTPKRSDGSVAAGSSPRQYAAFMSYSSKDRGFASHLHRFLEYRFRWLGRDVRDELGRLEIAIDYHAVKPGDSVREAVLEKVRASRRLIVLVSPNSVQSKWVKEEIRVFREHHGPNADITTVMIEAEDPIGPSSFPQELISGEDYPASIDYRRLRWSWHRPWRLWLPWNELLRVYAEILGLEHEALLDRQCGYNSARRRRIRLAICVPSVLLACIALWALEQQAHLVMIETSAIENPIEKDTFSEGVTVHGESGRVIKGFDDGIVRIIGPYGSMREILNPLAGIVMDVEMLDDDAFIGVALESSIVRAWSLTDGVPIWEFENPTGTAFICVGVHPATGTIAAGDDDGAIHIWRVGRSGAVETIHVPMPSGFELEEAGRINDLVFSEDGGELWVAHLDGVAARISLSSREISSFMIPDIVTIYSLAPVGDSLVIGCFGKYGGGKANQLVLRGPDGSTRVIETGESVYNNVVPLRQRGGMMSVCWTGDTVVWDSHMSPAQRWKRPAVVSGEISADVYSVAYDPDSGVVCIYTPERISWHQLHVRTIWGLPWF